MSLSGQNTSNVNDIVTSTNTVIQENLNKLNEKLLIIKNDLIEDEDDEYENFYNRLNFYFSTIISELKLNFLETLKNSQKNEKILQKENQLLKNQIEKNEQDILELMMENMLLKIENDNYEEKNMLNISHYVDVSPQPLSEKSSANSISREQKMLTAQKNKKSRNKRNNINTTSTNDDLSFKTELRNNINLKIKKKMAQNIIPHNNSTSSNLEIKKKSNLMNFLTHANVINRTSYNFNTNPGNTGINNIVKSISPKRNATKNTNGHHQHYKSFNSDINALGTHHHNNYLSGEKSMCNLPSYSLGKIKVAESRMKTSLNDLGTNKNSIKSYSKGKFMSIATSSSNKNQRTKGANSVNNKKISKTTGNKSCYNILGDNSCFTNDFEKYKNNLMNKIGFNANQNCNASTSNSGFNYLCSHNLKGIMNIKMNINKNNN